MLTLCFGNFFWKWFCWKFFCNIIFWNFFLPQPFLKLFFEILFEIFCVKFFWLNFLWNFFCKIYFHKFVWQNFFLSNISFECPCRSTDGETNMSRADTQIVDLGRGFTYRQNRTEIGRPVCWPHPYAMKGFDDNKHKWNKSK